MKIWVLSTRGKAEPYLFPEQYGPAIRDWFLQEAGLGRRVLDGVYQDQWGNEVGLSPTSFYIDDGPHAELVEVEQSFRL